MSDIRLKNNEIKILFKKLGRQILNPAKRTTDELRKYELTMLPVRSKVSEKTRNPLIIIEGEEYQIYTRLVNLIIQEPLSEHLERKQIDEILGEFTNKVFENSEKFKKMDILNKEIDDTIQSLLQPFEEWHAIAPIDGLKMNFKKIQIKNHFIKKFQRSEKSQYFENTNKMFKKYIAEELIGRYCIFVTVKSNNKDSALEKGEEKIKQILNSIMIFHGSNTFCKIIDPTTIIVIKKKIKSGSVTQRFNKSIKCEIIKSDSRPLRQFMSLFSPMLNIETPNTFEDKILKGLNWIGLAIRDDRPEDKISKFFTGLEALLVHEKEGKKGELLAFRIALLQNKTNRQFTFPDRTLYLYEKRSEIVHGGQYNKDPPNKQDVSSLAYLATSVIINICKIQSKKKFCSPKKFVRWLEKENGEKQKMIKWIEKNSSEKLNEFLSKHS